VVILKFSKTRRKWVPEMVLPLWMVIVIVGGGLVLGIIWYRQWSRKKRAEMQELLDRAWSAPIPPGLANAYYAYMAKREAHREQVIDESGLSEEHKQHLRESLESKPTIIENPPSSARRNHR
jgi:hypothetical protein